MDTNDRIAILATFALTTIIYLRNKRRNSPPFPPGPKPVPLLGNLLDLPTSFEWETYARWSKEYDSDIIHLTVAGSNIVILNSLEAANELLDRRSSMYSSRPHFTMAIDLMGWDWFMSALPYGERWRQRRRLFTKHINPKNGKVHQPVQLEFIRKMAIRILEIPDEFLSITRHSIGGLSLSLAYGLPIQKQDDPYITLAEKANESLAAAAIPGTYLVDTIPFLKYVPSWMPGAGFQIKAAENRKLQELFRNLPFDATVQNMASGVAKSSFVSTCFQNLDEGEDEALQAEVIKDTAAMIFAAGADTTVSSVQTLFLAMVNYPNIQAKAQEELDHVLCGRLPDFHDEPDLPYLSALVKEITRWQPVAPIAVPHYATNDDTYEGYHIPKGAVVIANSWAMLHDESVYSDPFTFKPERFLNEDGQLNPAVQDPALVAFGYGRRICPGSHIALSALWLTAATILSTFRISKKIGKDGAVIEAPVKYRSGLIYHPEPFTCSIQPRSNEAELMIRSVVDAC